MNYKLVVYIPENHLDKVKQSLFDAGAGRQGDYEHCCWQSMGTGQFRPLEGAYPHIGAVGRTENVPEWRLEVLVGALVVNQVKEALLANHPYEQPAYDFFLRAEI